MKSKHITGLYLILKPGWFDYKYWNFKKVIEGMYNGFTPCCYKDYFGLSEDIGMLFYNNQLHFYSELTIEYTEIENSIYVLCSGHEALEGSYNFLECLYNITNSKRSNIYFVAS